MPKQMDSRLAYEDPLLASRDFFHSATFYPLGFPVKIDTNSPEVLRAAAASWSFFPKAFDRAPIYLSLGVTDSRDGHLPAIPTFRSRGHLLSMVSDGENFIVSDFARGYQFGWISEAVVRNHRFFRYYFLDVAVLTAIQQKHLAPIHGACVSRNGRGVVLCGESSAGKSTLSYACSRAGWTYVSDDATFLVRSETSRFVVGNCHTIRFRESSKRFFPEIFHFPASTRANGTQRIEAWTRDLPIARAPGCFVDHIVFLQREDSGAPVIRSATKQQALDWFTSFASYGDEEVRNSQLKTYENLLSVPVWELSYQNLDDAISLLNGLM